MSRIGKLPIELPEGVTYEQNAGVVTIKGAKGELSLKLLPGFALEQKENRLELSVTTENPLTQAQYGLMRTLLANMTVGVSEGFSKVLEVQGVGFRVSVAGNKLTLGLGFSHPVEFIAPEGIELKVEQTTITITGIDKQQVGQVAAQIRELKKPEPYKGKGIRYQDEVVRRKAGKAAAKATGA